MRVKLRVVSGVFFLLFWLVVNIGIVFALEITEIHFDPPGADTDREWIEVYNNTENSLDLTEIKFFEANVNHGISLFEQPNSTEKNILPKEYVVVVQNYTKFLTDFPGYNGKIFKASFSLSNSGEYLALKNKEGGIIFSITYTENDKQINPSPGQANTGGTVLINESTSTTSSATTTFPNFKDTTSSPEINYFTRSFWPESEKIYLRAGQNRVVMRGQEIIFNPKVLDGSKKEAKSGVQYRWSFGDGYTSEKREGVHTYKFTGEFVVNLQVNYNGLTEDDRVYIKVIEPKLGVKIVGELLDVGTSSQKILTDVIEIKNDNKFELNIGGLQIVNERGKIFSLPETLIVLGGKSIYLSPELTGFSNTTEKVILRLSNGKVIAEDNKPTLVQTSGSSKILPSVASDTIQVFTLDEFQARQKNFIQEVPVKSSPIKITNNNATRKVMSKSQVNETIAEVSIENTLPKVDSPNLNKIEFTNKTKPLWQKILGLWQ